jgi:hypothetical protein
MSTLPESEHAGGSATHCAETVAADVEAGAAAAASEHAAAAVLLHERRRWLIMSCLTWLVLLLVRPWRACVPARRSHVTSAQTKPAAYSACGGVSHVARAAGPR